MDTSDVLTRKHNTHTLVDTRDVLTLVCPTNTGAHTRSHLKDTWAPMSLEELQELIALRG
jgi:hypothetical protein